MEAEKKIILKAKKDIKAFDYLYRKYYPKINIYTLYLIVYLVAILSKYSNHLT
ncbi:MAG: hypothetical protein H8D22_02755 [Candidatus Cloacimonetes bacterium]|nr:hypothetical protein [Candidatus Cloacimonadota bacterium]